MLVLFYLLKLQFQMDNVSFDVVDNIFWVSDLTVPSLAGAASEKRKAKKLFDKADDINYISFSHRSQLGIIATNVVIRP